MNSRFLWRARPRLSLPVLLLLVSSSFSFGESTWRDPTQPLNTPSQSAAASPDNLVLNSVLLSTARKLAVINGESVGENDTVAGARVLRILEDRVIVRYRGEEQVLLLTRPIKQQSEG